MTIIGGNGRLRLKNMVFEKERNISFRLNTFKLESKFLSKFPKENISRQVMDALSTFLRLAQLF